MQVVVKFEMEPNSPWTPASAEDAVLEVLTEAGLYDAGGQLSGMRIDGIVASPEAPWLVLRLPFAHCNRCGVDEPSPAPVSIDAFLKYIEYLNAKHEACPPGSPPEGATS